MKTATAKPTSAAHFADTKPHYELLDGLRGVAALLVIVYHIFEGFAFAAAQNGEGSGLITTFNHGHTAVDFFFILSGFVISYAYDDRWRKLSLGGFFKRRLIRLQPMLVMGAVLGALSFLVSGCERWDGTTTPISWVMVALLMTMFMIPSMQGARSDVRGFYSSSIYKVTICIGGFAGGVACMVLCRRCVGVQQRGRWLDVGQPEFLGWHVAHDVPIYDRNAVVSHL